VDGESNGAISGLNKFKMAAAAILEQFQMAIFPQRLIRSNSAHSAVIFAMAQLSCHGYCTFHGQHKIFRGQKITDMDNSHIGKFSNKQDVLWTLAVHGDFYRAMHFSAERGIAIACRLSVCDVGEL